MAQASGVFSGVRAPWLPLYQQFRSRAKKTLGAFTEHETSRGIIWKHAGSFAEFNARRDALVIAFPAETERAEWNAAKTLRTSKNRVVHYFDITGDRGFDELLARLQDAYALTGTGRAAPTGRAASAGDGAPAGDGAVTTIDEYIARYPAEQQEIMRKVREMIRRAAPSAAEKISYQMPTFFQRRNLVHFAAMKNHLGFYPGSGGVAAFADELAPYKTSKGSIQFPWTEPIPYRLIERITRSRVRAEESAAPTGRAGK
ncbi:MAG: DUF5655 domain-containing protein [Spirochaetaceae bacterium]|jgi:uncharacterized protein YdhG (YjbR/CyaY superfamily)|nr:DUF5655 domain-containing protein [Spirochaetaceae bacterium]